jgi:uroporphyrinogen decarboxylase
VTRDAVSLHVPRSPLNAPTVSSQQQPLLVRTARREPAERTPIWLMRQAGRVLPEYREKKGTRSLLEISEIPELCAEITLQPLARMPLDAAIIYADIMTPLVGVGVDLEIREGVGPVIAEPVREARHVERLRALEPEADVGYLLETLRIVKRALPADKALIGFAGAPFTLASYLIEGRGSRDFLKTKGMMYGAPELWHALMDRLSAIVTAYLRAQAAAGADVLQLFDSWVGALGPDDYREYVAPYSARILGDLRDTGVPLIHFGTNTATVLEQMRGHGADVIGVDWRIALDDAWRIVGDGHAVQGNLDPAALVGPWTHVEARARDVLRRAAGRPGHIFNLGHGLHPTTPLDNVVRLVELVRAQGT